MQDAVDKGYFRMSPVTSAPLLESAIVCVAKELASGFACLHANGILHCDISGGDFCHITNDMGVGSGIFNNIHISVLIMISSSVLAFVQETFFCNRQTLSLMVLLSKSLTLDWPDGQAMQNVTQRLGPIRILRQKS